MKQDRGKTLAARGAEKTTGVERLRPWLAGAVCALFVARPLFVSESAAQGDGQVMVMLWVLLGAVWLGLKVLGLGRTSHPASLSCPLSRGERERNILTLALSQGEREGGGIGVSWGWVETALAVFIGWHCLAAIWATQVGSPRPALNLLWEWVALGLSFFLARQLLLGPRERRAAAALMLSLAVTLAADGLYQYAVELPATRALYKSNPEQALRDAGLWFDGPAERQLFEKRLESVEPLATFALTNSLAGFLAPWLVIAFGIAAMGVPDRRTGRLTWPTVGLAAMIVGGCLLLTKSRGAYIAAGFGALLVGALAWTGRPEGRRIGWKPPLAILGAGLAALTSILAARAAGGLDREIFTEATKSLGYRLQYWESSLRMIADHPWLGIGPGNFQDVYLQYKLPEASEEVGDPHNFLLEVWATAGTPAALALLAMLAAFGLAVMRGSRKPREEIPADFPGVVLAGGIAGFLFSLPVGMLSSAPPGIVVYVLGLPLFAGSIVALSAWVYRGRFPALLPAAGLIVLLLNLLVAGGISFSGVSGTLWLLMALALNESESAESEADSGEKSCRRTPCAPGPWEPEASTRDVSEAPAHGLEAAAHAVRLLLRAIRLPLLVAGIVAVVAACFLTGYWPVIRGQRAMRLAIWDAPEREAHLREAVAADPWAAEPRIELAGHLFQVWRATGSPGALAEFERVKEEALQRAPRAADAWHYFAGLYREAFEVAGERRLLEKAVEAYRQTVELYPNHATYRADLAEALRAAGDDAGFRAQKAEALRLDAITPHEDKKLQPEQRRRIEKEEARSEQ